MENNEIRSILDKLRREVSKVVVEQTGLTDFCITALLSGGHLLVEGVPGLAKTLFARTFATALGLACTRIQFTPDLMPSDIIGTKVFNLQERMFELKKGPVFTQVILADEINRTPPKTQAALLEAMQDETVSIDGDTLPLPLPFFVMATQNPIEHEGTYPLPEALIDRFLFKLDVGYPSAEGETEVLRRLQQMHAVKLSPASCAVESVCSVQDVMALQEAAGKIRVEEALLRYMVDIVRATRENHFIENGASPRGCIALLASSRSWALLSGRDFVLPEDVKRVALPALRHRLIIKPEAVLDGIGPDDILTGILNEVKVPR